MNLTPNTDTGQSRWVTGYGSPGAIRKCPDCGYPMEIHQGYRGGGCPTDEEVLAWARDC